MHDWTKVDAAIFHAFRHRWITALCDALNANVLPADHYALPEQIATEFDARSAIVVRHVSGDRVVAMIEIVSPGNKASKNAVRALVTKTCELLEQRVHLLIADPFPPGPRDPAGVHGLVWEEMTGDTYSLPADKPLTLVAYESELVTRAYVETIVVGDTLPDMPLFLEPDGCVMVPLEATYCAAFEAQPRRWRDVLQPPVG
ncbi:Uncharacterized protein OS=Candidatus Entotheonella sp. TSY2 GN=ETSY2_30415 PE=4 SV=1: DUF4058 [Gemmata massiliana]|uniref:DUF4058 domain-containing protein n=1 Tax=Gemmata massiliana TaxID=1210884 RepID=A0A6P2DBL0_9BACT|nr:DUF4058 family protein [Gemmata massiliana]VTR97755.1 Uncharacterized protein OS=Candidatus Entotheonella sp. TSY2 GN=ETSY2_30415 PE=4 SV=1: DUF4058 [Gemmata massiliana]